MKLVTYETREGALRLGALLDAERALRARGRPRRRRRRPLRGRRRCGGRERLRLELHQALLDAGEEGLDAARRALAFVQEQGAEA